MIIDNFDLILNSDTFWQFDAAKANSTNEADNFCYAVIIMRREKDQLAENAPLKIFETILVYSKEELADIREYVTDISDSLNARVYISANPINLLNVLKYINNTYSSLYNKMFEFPGCIKIAGGFEYWSIACQYNQEKLLYLIDCDTFDEPTRDEIKSLINYESDEDKVLLTVPSFAGCHFITKPFNKDIFKKFAHEKGLDLNVAHIINDPLTLLYFNRKFKK